MSVYLFPKLPKEVYHSRGDYVVVNKPLSFGFDPATSGQDVTVSYNFKPLTFSTMQKAISTLKMVSGSGMSVPQPPPSQPPNAGIARCSDVEEALCGCMHKSQYHFTGDRQEDVSLIIGSRVSIIPIVKHRSCHYIGCTCPAWETDNIQWLHNRKYLSQQPDVQEGNSKKDVRGRIQL